MHFDSWESLSRAISVLVERILLDEITREQRRSFMTSHSTQGTAATEIYSLHCNGTLHNALHGAKKSSFWREKNIS